MAERSVGWPKESRRLGIRHEEPAVNSRAMVELAVTRLCLRKLDSPDRT